MFPELSNIYLKGPFWNGSNTIFKITEKKKDKKIPLQITTPLCLINSISNNFSTFLLSYDNINIKDSLDIGKFFINIEKTIKKKKRDFIGSHLLSNSTEFISCIKNWNNNHYLQLWKNHLYIEVYDNQKNKIDITQLNKKSLVKMLIWVNELVITNSKWYLNLNIMQIRMFDPLPPIGCIIDNKEDNPKTKHKEDIIQDPKYQRMMKMGVPLAAIKNKMKMDGVEIGGAMRIQPNMLAGIKLKKALPLPKLPSKLKPKTNQLIPSLQDIQLQLQSLKKTKRQY